MYIQREDNLYNYKGQMPGTKVPLYGGSTVINSLFLLHWLFCYIVFIEVLIVLVCPSITIFVYLNYFSRLTSECE